PTRRRRGSPLSPPPPKRRAVRRRPPRPPPLSKSGSRRRRPPPQRRGRRSASWRASMTDEIDELFPGTEAYEYRATIDRLQRQLAKEKVRTEAILEAVYAAVHDSIAALTIPPVKPPKKDRRTKGEETAVLMLSDWQLGKKTP